MATINIAGMTPVEDPSYRYKMPKVLGKVEGRGNGIKTVLVNVTDVGLALNREPPEITKFFGCELGSQTTYAADTDRAVVNGAHIDGDLQKHLSRYIENFVLCKNCRLPETHYKIKDGLISQKCLACGAKETVDMTHKLTAFILAQHKKSKELKKATEKAAGKDDKKKDKDKDKDKDKEKKEKKEKVADADSKEVGEKPKDKKKKDKEGDSEKKDKKDKKKSSDGAGSPSHGDSEKASVFGFDADNAEENVEEETDSKAADEAMQRYTLWTSLNASATTQQRVDELRAIQTMSSLRPADRIIIFLGAEFTENFISKSEIQQHRDIIAALAPSEIQQRHLIAAFEWLCGTRYPNLVKFFPVALKQLLDEELVDEASFFLWHADTARNEFSAEMSMMCLDTLEHLKESASMFINWLMEAESDDDGEGGEEDDDEDEDEDEEDDE